MGLLVSQNDIFHKYNRESENLSQLFVMLNLFQHLVLNHRYSEILKRFRMTSWEVFGITDTNLVFLRKILYYQFYQVIIDRLQVVDSFKFKVTKGFSCFVT